MQLRTFHFAFGLAAFFSDALASEVRAQVSFCSAFQTTFNGQFSIQYNVEMDNVNKDSRESICKNWFEHMKGRGVPLGCHCDVKTGKMEAAFHMETDLFTNPPQAGFISAMQTFQDVIGGSITATPGGNLQCFVQDYNTDVPTVPSTPGDLVGTLSTTDNTTTGSLVTDPDASNATTASPVRRQVDRPPIANGRVLTLASGVQLIVASANSDILSNINRPQIPFFDTPGFSDTVVGMIDAVTQAITNGQKEADLAIGIPSMPTQFQVSFNTGVDGKVQALARADVQMLIIAMLETMLPIAKAINNNFLSIALSPLPGKPADPIGPATMILHAIFLQQ
ncbi:uncharacterized protein LTR77_001814 [Saxophila tyrrhenica]|uniref:Uncharacterized protein n=1 Tax=Saxophila tyrrhenica TaxID=1690608 RepID=A0AAV9PQW8_9PEZI|nr:hypothetical protein LTR77_001814 [Saxophila tyrrhenica]